VRGLGLWNRLSLLSHGLQRRVPKANLITSDQQLKLLNCSSVREVSETCFWDNSNNGLVEIDGNQTDPE
jgi:hypothetical protein